MIYKMQLSDSVDTMIFELLEVPIEGKDITGIADNTTIDGNVFRDYLWLKKQWTQRWSIMCQDEYERLRGFWTRQFGNAEVPLYRLFYGNNVYEDKNTFTVNGFVEIENDAPLYSPLSLANLYGNATQETLSGKNLLNYGQLTYSFPANANTKTVIGSIDLTAGTTYYITYDVQTATSTSQRNTPYLEINNTQYYQNTASNYNTTTGRKTWQYVATTTGTYTIGYWCHTPNVAVNIANFMISTSSDNTFEEYTGGSPMPNPQFPSPVNVVSGAQEVKICGKNLFDRANASENMILSWLNAQIISENKSITSDYISIKEGDNIASNYIFYVFCYDASKNYLGAIQVGETTISKNTGTAKKVFTIPSGYGIKYIKAEYRTGINSGTDMTQQDIMLQFGSTATAYESYQGQTQIINLGGTNMLNIPDGTYTAGSMQVVFENGIGKISGDATGTPAIDIPLSFTLKAGTYTLSSNITQPNYPYVALRTPANTNILTTSSSSKTDTQTIASDTAVGYIRLYFGQQRDWDTVSPQLEANDHATKFVPYTTYAYELAKIGTYQDYIWNDGGTWKIHKEVGKVVLNGSESWTSFDTHSGSHITTNVRVGDIIKTTSVIPFCDNFTGATIAQTWGGTIAFGVANYVGTSINPYLQFSMANGFVADVNAWKTWLSTHPTTVYYALNTPTDTEITDSELIEQLDHIYSLYGGVNNLWLIPSGGAQGEIGVKYRLNYEEETDIVPSTPVVLTLSDGGVINTCGCRQNIQLIMRETTQGDSES